MKIFGCCWIFAVYSLDKGVDIGLLFVNLVVEVSFVNDCTYISALKVRLVVVLSRLVLTFRWT